jgi:hypothetical protein
MLSTKKKNMQKLKTNEVKEAHLNFVKFIDQRIKITKMKPFAIDL